MQSGILVCGQLLYYVLWFCIISLLHINNNNKVYMLCVLSSNISKRNTQLKHNFEMHHIYKYVWLLVINIVFDDKYNNQKMFTQIVIRIYNVPTYILEQLQITHSEKCDYSITYNPLTILLNFK